MYEKPEIRPPAHQQEAGAHHLGEAGLLQCKLRDYQYASADLIVLQQVVDGARPTRVFHRHNSAQELPHADVREMLRRRPACPGPRENANYHHTPRTRYFTIFRSTRPLQILASR